MRQPFTALLAPLLLLWAAEAFAQETDHRIAPGKEPEVRVIEEEDRTVEEYSINGQVYMIKVKPDVGPPYYLIDRDGDGDWENRRNNLGGDFTPPQWIIFEW
jgi:hypothetical protein